MTLLLGTCLGLLFSLTECSAVEFNAGADIVKDKEVFLGEHVSLPCHNLVTQTDCSKVTWLSNDNPVMELVTLGKLKPDKSEREGRVSLIMSSCSLNINQIKAGDKGCYTCRQYSGVHESQIEGEARICLIVNKTATSMKNDGSTDDRKELLMRIIPSVLIVSALSVTALFIWLRFHSRVQTSAKDQDILKHETKTIEDEHKNGEDVNYTELNYNVMKTRNVDIDIVDIHQKTEYAVIKLS